MTVSQDSRSSIGLRSAAFLVGLSVSVVLYAIPLSIVGWFLPASTLHRIGRTWGRLNLWLLKTLCRLDYRVEGLERMPDGASIVLSKHQSAWETIAFRVILPLAQTWVLKRELLWIPFFGWGLAPYRPIAINREAGRKAVRELIERGSFWLRKGHCVIIFPEGTRVAPGQRRRYGIGGATLAAQTQALIVPIAHNAGVYWPRRSLLKYPGLIEVRIGNPISPAGRSAQQINHEVEEWIETTTKSLPCNQQVLSATTADEGRRSQTV